MKRGLCLLVLTAAAGGCLDMELRERAARDPRPAAPPARRTPAVTPEQVTEENAREKSEALREELDEAQRKGKDEALFLELERASRRGGGKAPEKP
jgi:hypothetical protein